MRDASKSTGPMGSSPWAARGTGQAQGCTQTDLLGAGVLVKEPVAWVVIAARY